MYKVGIVTGVLSDKTRNNWAGDGPRPIAYIAWYPADNNARGEKLCVKHSAKDAPFVITGGFINAAINNTQKVWPVVLLSHGTGGSALGMDWLGSKLAAAGFIAIAVSHHGNTITEPYLPEGFLCWWERAADLTFALDVLASDGVLRGAIDFEQTFAAGFSLGAYTVLALAGAITDMQLFDDWLEKHAPKGPTGPKEFPDLSSHIPELIANSAEFRASQARQHLDYRDSRMRAVVALAPPPPIRAFTRQSLAKINLPVNIVAGQADCHAPHQTCAQWLDRQLPDSKLTLLGKNVGHYVFLNEATQFGQSTEPDFCLDAKGVDRSAIHHQTTQATITLFGDVMTALRV